MALPETISHPVPASATLFRREVIQASTEDRFGAIALVHPPALRLSVVLALSAFLVAGFFLWGVHYTDRAELPGSLVPDTGTIAIYPSLQGTVKQIFVRDGEEVKPGALLMQVSSTRPSMVPGLTAESSTREQLKARVSLLQTERRDTGELSRLHQERLRTQIEQMKAQLAALKKEEFFAREKLGQQQGQFQTKQQLFDERLISASELRDCRITVMEQEKTAEETSRQSAQLGGELAGLENELAALPPTLEKDTSTIDRDLSALTESLDQNALEQLSPVTAQLGGTISTVLAQTGAQVQPSNPVVTLLPNYKQLYARVYATSKAIGFIRPGSPVHIRYQSFPYQKFGSFEAHIADISAMPLSPVEYALRTGLSASEPMYEVRVVLSSQMGALARSRVVLQPGMLVSVDVPIETRRLLEWVLGPILDGKRGMTL